MKRKIILHLVIFLVLVVMMGAVAPIAAQSTTFYLDPAMKYAKAGDQFILTLRVDAVTDMYLWVVTIEWDPAYFDLVGDPIEGGCLKYGGKPTTFLWASITDGKIERLTCSRLGEISGANVPPAPNDMTAFTLKTQKTPPDGGTPIRITFARYLNSAGTEYAPIREGTLVSPSPAVGGVQIPVDKFGLLAPYIGLASTIIVATVATAIYVNRVKRREEE